MLCPSFNRRFVPKPEVARDERHVRSTASRHHPGKCHLSAFRSKLAKKAPVISPHPLFNETTFIVKPEDV